jgi:CRISPR-associated protein Cas2
MVVIVYEIPNDKRRTKLSNFLEGYGRRVQWSVFECYLTIEEMRKLYQKVKKLVKSSEDSVRFYWLSREIISLTLTIGSEQPNPPPNYYVL